MHKKIIYFGGALILALVIIQDATAANLNTGMPWEGPMDQVVASITGPVARCGGAVALTATGLAWALGVGNDILQRGAKIGTALSIAFNAASHLLPILGFANGLLI